MGGELSTPKQERQLTQEEREFLETLPERVDVFLTNYPYQPLDFSLSSLDFPHDVSYLDLPSETQKLIRETWFKQIGFEPDKPKIKDEYDFDAPQPVGAKGPSWSGQTHVTIYEAGKNEEGETYFLHQLDYPDETTDYLVAPEDFRL